MTTRADRVEAAKANRATIESIAGGFGFTVDVKNDGQHWIFSGNGRLAEWWPSRGTFAGNKRYHHSMTVFDLRDLRAELGAVMKGPPMMPMPPKTARVHGTRAAKPADGCMVCGKPCDESMCPTCQRAWAPKTDRSAWR